MALLSKVSDGNYTSTGTPNERVLKYPNCDQVYRLVCSELEGHHLFAWLITGS